MYSIIHLGPQPCYLRTVLSCVFNQQGASSLRQKISLSRRFIVAFKKKSFSGQVTGCIGFTQQIADTLRQKIKAHGKLFDSMVDIFANFPEGTKTMNKYKVWEGVFCKSAVIIPSIIGCTPNLNCNFSFMPILHVTIVGLTAAFELSFMEIASVLCCHDFTAECNYYFVVSAILKMKYHQLKSIKHRGLKFGWQFFKFICALRAQKKEKGLTNIIGLCNWYAEHDKECFYTRKQYDKLLYFWLLLCFWGGANHSEQPWKKDDADKVYRNFLEVYRMNAKKVDITPIGWWITPFLFWGK